MIYTKKDFARRLREEIAAGYQIVRIARWAHRELLAHGKDLEAGLREEMMKVIVMEEGPEFEMTEQEVRDFISELEGR